ncbi:ATPase domain-containing cell division control protein, putative [Eimeria maxima]|uniref:ATPase domain-containing cell division control protein, putative n=1 Tax=Eimeria maxima TaxID=5804 RepID=U6MHJ2_EIMMA|nr:ATPase domain-containing cell division control protein, putative [Eimeria maxima]CDJ61939.1 ATPase domain-containing cell division control protein, putative [Eimeria maxima]
MLLYPQAISCNKGNEPAAAVPPAAAATAAAATSAAVPLWQPSTAGAPLPRVAVATADGDNWLVLESSSSGSSSGDECSSSSRVDVFRPSHTYRWRRVSSSQAEGRCSPVTATAADVPGTAAAATEAVADGAVSRLGASVRSSPSVLLRRDRFGDYLLLLDQQQQLWLRRICSCCHGGRDPQVQQLLLLLRNAFAFTFLREAAAATAAAATTTVNAGAPTGAATSATAATPSETEEEAAAVEVARAAAAAAASNGQGARHFCRAVASHAPWLPPVTTSFSPESAAAAAAAAAGQPAAEAAAAAAQATAKTTCGEVCGSAEGRGVHRILLGDYTTRLLPPVNSSSIGSRAGNSSSCFCRYRRSSSMWGPGQERSPRAQPLKHQQQQKQQQQQQQCAPSQRAPLRTSCFRCCAAEALCGGSSKSSSSSTNGAAATGLSLQSQLAAAIAEARARQTLFRKSLLQLAQKEQQQLEQQQQPPPDEEPLTEQQLSLLLSCGGAVFVVLECMHLLLQLQPSHTSSSSSSNNRRTDLRSVLLQQLSAFAATCSSEGLPVFVFVPFNTGEAAAAAVAVSAAPRGLLPLRPRLAELVGRDLLQPYLIEGVLTLPEALSEQHRAAILLLLLRRVHAAVAAADKDENHIQRLATLGGLWTCGFTVADLRSLLRTAVTNCMQRQLYSSSSSKLCAADLRQALLYVCPSALRLLQVGSVQRLLPPLVVPQDAEASEVFAAAAASPAAEGRLTYFAYTRGRNNNSSSNSSNSSSSDSSSDTSTSDGDSRRGGGDRNSSRCNRSRCCCGCCCLKTLQGLKAVRGHRRLIRLLKREVVQPFKQQVGAEPAAAAEAETVAAAPLGCVVEGPSGSGKSFLCSSLAVAAGAVLLRLSAADVLRKEVAAADKQLLAAFSTLRRCFPAVLLIEDIDILCNSNSSSSSKILGTLLQQLDELVLLRRFSADATQRKTALSVLLLATATDVTKIDTRLLLPGRLSYVFSLNSNSRRDPAAAAATLLQQCLVGRCSPTIRKADLLQLTRSLISNSRSSSSNSSGAAATAPRTVSPTFCVCLCQEAAVAAVRRQQTQQQQQQKAQKQQHQGVMIELCDLVEGAKRMRLPA